MSNSNKKKSKKNASNFNFKIRPSIDHDHDRVAEAGGRVRSGQVGVHRAERPRRHRVSVQEHRASRRRLFGIASGRYSLLFRFEDTNDV